MIENFRQYRIGPFAIFDFLGTYLIVILLSPLLTKLFAKAGLRVGLLQLLLLTLPVSIISHIVLGIDTALVEMFLDASGHYFTKVVIILMSVGGILGIKKIK